MRRRFARWVMKQDLLKGVLNKRLFKEVQRLKWMWWLWKFAWMLERRVLDKFGLLAMMSFQQGIGNDSELCVYVRVWLKVVKI